MEQSQMRIIPRNQTEALGCNVFYQSILENSESIDCISKFVPQICETFKPNDLDQSKSLKCTEITNQLLNTVIEFDKNPKRRVVYNIALEITKELKLFEITFELLDRLIQEYFPNYGINNVIEILVLLADIVKIIVEKSFEASAGSSFYEQALVKSGDFRIVLCFEAFRYVQMAICGLVKRKGGWEVVCQKTGQFLNDNKWAIITGVLSSIALVGLIVGKALVDSKRKK